MPQPLRIVFDEEGRVILEITPAMAALLRHVLEVTEDVGGMLRADLTQFASAAMIFEWIDDGCIYKGSATFGIASINQESKPDVAALPAAASVKGRKAGTPTRAAKGRSAPKRGGVQAIPQAGKTRPSKKGKR